MVQETTISMLLYSRGAPFVGVEAIFSVQVPMSSDATGVMAIAASL